jgi:transposase
MAGRATKLTTEVRDKILHAIRQGNYACVAAQYAGIGESTFYLWLQRGARGERPYVEFLEAVKGAEAEAEVKLVELVRLSAVDNWQAAMTTLERRYPERWRRRDELNFRNLTDEEIIERAARLFGGNAAPWLELPDGDREPDALSE